MTAPLLEVRGIRKQYPGVLALDGVSLSVRAGEVLALVGENGAGKSTLMKVLAGIVIPDKGEIILDGEPAQFQKVSDAQKKGIILIHQELNLADNLSVAGNIFLGKEKTTGGPLGFLSRGKMDREAGELLKRVGLSCSPGTIVDTLKVGQQQLVEIARALGMKARVLIMDEPTSSLTQTETDRLCALIAELKQAGVAIVYISHRLAEVRTVADRVEVLRDGRNAGQLSKAEISHDNLVRLMVGRDLKQLYPHKRNTKGAETVLEVEGLQFEGGGPAAVSFRLQKGEIVGMGGLVGAGRTELAEALFGLRPIRSGTVKLKGHAVRIRSPRDAVDAGLVLAPEDRRLHGLVLDATIRANISLPNYEKLNRAGVIVPGSETSLALKMMQLLQVKASGPGQQVGQLSGGNQQKVVLGKWLARRPAVLILDEPTRGVDVGAREQIYSLMDQLAGEGMTILMISSDMEELLGMSDRILVLHEGKLSGELTHEKFSETAVMNLATASGQPVPAMAH